MMKSFRDPVTGVLRSWGYTEASGDDLARDEPEDFNLEAGKWQLVGDVWQPYEPVIVPQQVTRRQGLQALVLKGYLDQVQPAIDRIEDLTKRKLAQIEFDESQFFERNRPLVSFLCSQIGLTEDQKDELFIFAATL